MKINTELLHSLSKERYLTYIRALPNFREEKIQNYATVILTLIAFMVFSIFAIGPTISTITELKKTLADNLYINSQLETKITSMSQLQQSFTALSPQLPLLYNAIPKTPETAKLSGQIRSLADEEGVRISQLQIQSVDIAKGGKEKNTLRPMTLTIAVLGDYSSLQSFYTALISFDRVMNISSLTLLLPSESKTESYRLTIQAQAFYRP